MDFSRRRNKSRLEGPSSTLIDVSARDVNITVFCDNGERTERIKEAFDAFQDVGETMWMTLEEIKECSRPANFVCDPFEGELFEYLRNRQLPVYGPLVILRCLRDKRPLPLAPKPVFSQAMKDVVVTFSSVAPEGRTRLAQRVEFMGGRVEAPLNISVTHVICDEVGSKKYIVGSLRGLALQTTAWIDVVWDRVQHELKHAISVADEYKTQIFANLAITSSGLDEAEKEKMKKLVSQNGGTYTGKLTKANTHLIIKEATGAKYRAAVSWQLHIVTPDWVNDSVEKGFMIDPTQYYLKDCRSSQASLNCSVSSIASTVAGSRSVLSERTNSMDPMYSEVLKLTKEDMASAGQFLDGCSVHVYGIKEKTLLERLEQIINEAGGLREDAFNDGVSHVITLPSASGLLELQKNIENSFASPSVVLPSWLAACVRRKSLLPAGSYSCPGFDPPPDEEISCATSFSSVGSIKEQKGCLIGKNFCLTEELRTTYLNVAHDLPALRDRIENFGGRLVDSDSEQGTTYIVYPMMVSGAEVKPNAITILHLETVVNQKRWIPPSDSSFYSVIHAPKADLPNAVLKDVVVTPTGFTEHEVDSMTKVLALFSGTLQVLMVKTSKPGKKLVGTTHLICATENHNSKVDAAQRWKIPAVSLSWLLACAREGRKVSVKDHLIEKKQWETLPEDKRKASPKKSVCDTPLDRRKKPIELGTSQMESEIQEKPQDTPNTTRVSVGAANTPVLSSQRMREIYEEASRFKTPKTSAVSDVDSPGVPRIGSERIAEMIRNIQESPHPYEVPEASFDERNSQAVSVKTALTKGRPLDGCVVLLDEESVGPLSFELKMSIERLGGWVCHTIERCSVVVSGRQSSDNSRAITVRAQRLEKPIVGVEWIYAAIDTMKLPAYEDFPTDYEALKGKYIRSKTFKDHENPMNDSDLDSPKTKIADKRSPPSSTEQEASRTITEALTVTPTTRLATLKRQSAASNSTTTPIPGTPLCAAAGNKVTNDPLRDLISSNQRASLVSTPGRAFKTIEEEPRSLLRKSQIGLNHQDSSGSVLADIETQPEEGITYGGKMGIPTSTQLLNTTSDEPVDPNFGDLSIVKQRTDLAESPEKPTKRSRDDGDPGSSGKRFKKSVVSPKKKTVEKSLSEEKIFVLYHLDEDLAARCREIIAALGGSVIDDLSSETFSENATHKDPLMIIDPDKNRVFKKKSVLQQLASGGWILEPLYLEESEVKGHFLNEEDYVVGIGPKSSKFNDSRFACLRRWRQLRLERGTGAFDGWKVVLFSASIEREKGHRTLLQAGGATVLTEDKLAEATHVFLAKGDSVTAKKVREKVSAGVKVLANEYMLHYLSNAEVNPEQFSLQ